MSRQGWLAQDLAASAQTTTVADFGNYLEGIDKAIVEANKTLEQSILTIDGVPSQNPNLDGFIFEAEAAGSFNMDAALKNESIRAEVLAPASGEAYAANSADIAIKDSQGNTIKEYQAKCYNTAEKSNTAFEHGDYGDQEHLVPDGHEQEGSTSTLSHDGVSSKPVSKEDVKDKQTKAQEEGEIPQKSWNDYTTQELALEIGKQTTIAGLCGAGFGAVFHIATQVVEGEDIEGEEVAKQAIQSGARSASVCAIAATLKVVAEKSKESSTLPDLGTTVRTPVPLPSLSLRLPTCPHTLGAIASIAVDSAKTLWEVGTGEKTVKEGLYECERNAYATVGGLAGSLKGAALGASVGAIFTPVGAAIGGFVGSVVGGMAGSRVARVIATGAQKVRDCVVSGVKKAASAVASGVKSVCRALNPFNWF